MAQALDLVHDGQGVDCGRQRGLVRRGGAEADDAEILETDAELALLQASLSASASQVKILPWTAWSRKIRTSE